jgi:DNA-binding Lrp family transcriptional regulator
MSSTTDHRKDLDRIDLKILEALQRDGRITNRTLAKQVGLSPSACLARVNRLEEDGLILGYHARLAVDLIRPTLVIFAEVSFKRHFLTDFDKFDAFLATLPEVVEGSRVSGAYDYILKVVVQDIREWQALCLRLLEEESVEKISSHILMLEAKAFTGFPIKTSSRRATKA